jgi:DNA-binding transcriptional MocR family regulator
MIESAWTSGGCGTVIGMMTGSQLGRLLGDWHVGPGTRASTRTGVGRVPDYAALASTVRGLLADGRLPPGVRLPAERALAAALRISRTTVSAAYRDLRESGHLTSRRGAGSWTALPGGYRVASAGVWAPDEPDLIDFAQATLAAPAQLAEAVGKAGVDLTRYAAGGGYHPVGLGELRARIAEAYTRRGVPTAVEQIMITNGVQHAFDLILRLLATPGGSVLVESPTYPNSLAACAAHRTRVTPHGLDLAAGWDEELLLGAVRRGHHRLAYLITEFQNPTGHLMDHRLRERLPAAAHAAGTDLVVDESFVDLSLDDPRMPPPVAAFDRHSRVLSIGGMSKPYWGGLRVGWVRASAPLVQRLATVRVGADLASAVLDQLVAVHLLDHATEIIAARRDQLRVQRETLVAALRSELPQWRFTVPAGGVSLWVELDAPVSSALSRAAGDLGVRLVPGPRFGLDGTMERFVRLPYTLGVDDLREAVHRLAAARLGLDRSGGPAWPRDTPPI